MTEKEFRKIVAETEIQNSEKQPLLAKIDELVTIIEKNLPSYLILKRISKKGALKNGLLLKGETKLNLEIAIESSVSTNDNLKLINNALENIFLLNLKDTLITRKNNFSLQYEDGINVIINLTTELKPEINVSDILNNDYPLFKNTIRILKYYLKEQHIDVINDEVLINLLGYSVINYLVDYRYEGYIHAFIQGLDDFLKGSFIALSEKYYQQLRKELSYEAKTEYTIINFEDEQNLTGEMNQVQLTEYRKYRKCLQKLITVVDILASNQDLVIDINPKYNSITGYYNWSYVIENLNLTNSGGEYLDEEDQLLDAMYKSFQKALKVIIDKQLTRSSIVIKCRNLKILTEQENLNNEAKSRLRNIQTVIKENKLKITIK